LFSFEVVLWYLRTFQHFLRGNLIMAANTTDTTTAAPTKRLRSTGSMAALAAVVAVFSTGCTPAEIDQFLTILKIIGIFI
jgi:hypothetical protein